MLLKAWCVMNEIHACCKVALLFLREDSGQDMIEYALVVGAMAFTAIACLKGLATTFGNFVTLVGTTLTSAL